MHEKEEKAFQNLGFNDFFSSEDEKRTVLRYPLPSLLLIDGVRCSRSFVLSSLFRAIYL